MTNTITLTLPDDLAARLSVLPEDERNAFAVAAIARAAQSLAASDGAALPHGAETKPDELDELDELDEATLSAIGRGLADVDAGRTLSLDEARARADAVLETRFGKLPV